MMLRTRTDLWRMALMGSLGWFSNACTDATSDDVNNTMGESKEGATDDATGASTDSTDGQATDGEPSSDVTDEATDATSVETESTDDATDTSSIESTDVTTDEQPSGDATDDVTDATTDPTPTDDGPNVGADDSEPGDSETDAGVGAVDAGVDDPEPAPVTCTGATPIVVTSIDPDASDTIPTGLVTCDDGAVHRPEPVSCPDNLAHRADQTFTDGDEALTECSSDADCTAAPYGHCVMQGQLLHYVCEYGCVSDADCSENQFCQCGSAIGTCVTATCTSASDCGDGMLCAQWYDRVGIGCDEPAQFACQTPDDECVSEPDCGEQSGCAVVDGVRACTPIPGVACGRPFVVQGSAILADLAFSEAPFDASTCGNLPDAARLPTALRTALAEHWASVGLMEHASIAAFARFCLQLMHVGAPLDLLKASQAAMADETLHAELAFALASTYAGRPIGAGALPMNGALDTLSIDDIVRLVIVEGCIGETVAALEAAESQLHCQDAAVGATLARIREDETRHAQLAWRFVEWAITRFPHVAAIATEEFRTLEVDDAGATSIEPPTREEARALTHGVLSSALRSEVRRAALKDVVLPCAKRLLQRTARHGEVVAAA